uniref:Putative secreted protein n=1 Tax=Ixodes ricinus TaxID=34613 RepID=A0A6B0ULN6_IXORI
MLAQSQLSFSSYVFFWFWSSLGARSSILLASRLVASCCLQKLPTSMDHWDSWLINGSGSPGRTPTQHFCVTRAPLWPLAGDVENQRLRLSLSRYCRMCASVAERARSRAMPTSLLR